MPAYPGAVGATAPVNSPISPVALQRGESVYVLGQLKSGATQLPVNATNVDFEAAPAGATESSIAICLESNDSSGPPMICVEAIWNGAPGANESLAIQEADTDADAYYINPNNPAYTLNAPNANNTQRADLSPTGGKFMRVVRTKGANAVGIRVKITRMG